MTKQSWLGEMPQLCQTWEAAMKQRDKKAKQGQSSEEEELSEAAKENAASSVTRTNGVGDSKEKIILLVSFFS